MPTSQNSCITVLKKLNLMSSALESHIFANPSCCFLFIVFISNTPDKFSSGVTINTLAEYNNRHYDKMFFIFRVMLKWSEFDHQFTSNIFERVHSEHWSRSPFDLIVPTSHICNLSTRSPSIMAPVTPAYEDCGVNSRYIRQGFVIASHRILWDAITYLCLRYLLLAPKSSYVALEMVEMICSKFKSSYIPQWYEW